LRLRRPRRLRLRRPGEVERETEACEVEETEEIEVDDPDGIEVEEFVYKNKTYYKDPSTNNIYNDDLSDIIGRLKRMEI
jgi:hypothetical protein